MEEKKIKKRFNHLSQKQPKLGLRPETMPSGVRYYHTPDGLKLPSITTVLSLHNEKAIADWRKRVGEEFAEAERNRAAERGNIVHEMVERYLNNEDISFLQEYDKKYRILFNQLRMTLNRRVDNILMQEVALYSKKLKIAGRVDLVAGFDGVLSVIDFKGSNKSKKDIWVEHYKAQAAGYAYMVAELFGIAPTQTVIIMVGEDCSHQIFKSDPREWISFLKKYINQWWDQDPYLHSKEKYPAGAGSY